MIGGDKVSTVITLSGVLVRLGGCLLTAPWDIGIEIKSSMPFEIALVTLGIVSEFDRPAFAAIQPDGKAFIIEPHDVGSLHGCLRLGYYRRGGARCIWLVQLRVTALAILIIRTLRAMVQVATDV